MKLSTVKSSFLEELSNEYDREEVLSFFYQLIEAFLGENRFVLHLDPDFQINQEQFNQFDRALDDLKKHRPIQYIIGSVEFLSLRFKLSPFVLIPRPETEDLIIYLEGYIANNKVNRILDIGTGSGCIGLSLKQRAKEAEVDLMDVSLDALEVARKNAELNRLDVNLFQANVLELSTLNHTYDLIVSNPPYVRELEKKEMKPNVMNYEPHLALFVPNNDPLLFYRKIAILAKENLITGGMLCFEINEAFGKETEELLGAIGYQYIQIISDRFGKDRIVSARR